ncbi:Dehydrogenase/reductase SDR family member [Dirofilaria immitis]
MRILVKSNVRHKKISTRFRLSESILQDFYFTSSRPIRYKSLLLVGMWLLGRRLRPAKVFSSLPSYLRHSIVWASHKTSKEIKPLDGQVALVTGGARGVGRGIALQLAQAGAKVYVSGRKPNSNPGIPTLHDTTNEISSRGGKAVAVYCDHNKDDEVKELFQRIAKDENGRLDVLVNNAFSGANAMENNIGKKFFECQPSFWDEINRVGLRNVYICSVLASRMMVPRQKGLIVNISSAAGIRYFFNVPYGVGKAAVDRMSADMAEELKDYKVTVVSLWPGTVKTEKSYDWLKSGMLSKLTKMPQAQIERMVEKGETPEFVGRSVACLACDDRMLRKTGSILLTGDLCNEYMFLDNDGKIPSNMRALQFIGCLT